MFGFFKRDRPQPDSPPIPKSYWCFEPQPDITAYELAVLLRNTYGVLWTARLPPPNVPMAIADPLPQWFSELERHFRRATDEEVRPYEPA